jgi:hypothetical protein
VYERGQTLLVSSYSTGNLWFYSDAAFSAADTVKVNMTGDYVLTVTIDGCQGETSKNVDVITGLSDADSEGFHLRIYPNPVQRTLTIDMAQLVHREPDIRIIDSAGNRVYEAKNVSSEFRTIDVSGFKTGLYILYISFDNMDLPVRFVRR